MAHVLVTRFAGAVFRSSKRAGAAVSLLVAVLAFGCGSDGKSGAALPIGSIALKDENNYSTTSSLTIPTVETVAADLDICWGEVKRDLQCHDVYPLAQLDNLSLLRLLHLSEDEVEAKLTAGELSQSMVDGYLDYHTDHESTCTKLSSLSFFGTEIDVASEYTESPDRVYLLILSKGTTPGVGARTLTFVRPSESSSNTRVDMKDGCGMLAFTASLASATPVAVPAKAPWVVDWRGLTRDGQGNAIAFETVDRLMVGFFRDATVADLEEKIFDIELIATSLWEAQLSGGKKVDLSFLRERGSDAPFAGFTRRDGVWLLALLCSTCQNPQPVVLAILEPSAGTP